MDYCDQVQMILSGVLVSNADEFANLHLKAPLAGQQRNPPQTNLQPQVTMDL